MAEYTKVPRIVTSKKESVCAETGKVIGKGQQCWFDPATKHVYHSKSAKGAEFQKQLAI
jgi:hypothetical protein